MTELTISPPSEKQTAFLKARTKHVGFGGARGGGKSWAVRTKAKLLALRFPGIKILIIRRTYPELLNNHINILMPELKGAARYNKSEKVFKFACGSTIKLGYCANRAESDISTSSGYLSTVDMMTARTPTIMLLFNPSSPITRYSCSRSPTT